MEGKGMECQLGEETENKVPCNNKGKEVAKKPNQGKGGKKKKEE